MPASSHFLISWHLLLHLDELVLDTPGPTASSGGVIGCDEEATNAIGGRVIAFKLPRPSFVPDPAALYRLIEQHDLNVREELALYHQLPR